MKVTFGSVNLPLSHFELNLDRVIGPSPTALVGPSGAGKTTILEMIAGLRLPVSGTILLDEDLLSDGPQIVQALRDRAIGLVPQEDLLFRHLNAGANILYGAPSASRDRLRRLTDALAITPLLSQKVSWLSGGERRRVALARAVMRSPRLLLLDEPFKGMDRHSREASFAVIREEMTRGAGLILVSHDPEEAAALCERRIRVEQGQVVE